ncbi:MAG: hypothetical protein JWL73_472 [Actinomycetia bacterium]|nr:hypothetical protein [Actinomycetes bacterium]
MSRLVISADSHVVEPLDLWEQRLPPALRAEAVRHVVENDRMSVYIGGVLAFTAKMSKDDVEGSDSRHGAGFAEMQASAGGADLVQRLADIEADGISGEVIYPTAGLYIFMVEDPKVQDACARVYNDWCEEVFLPRGDVFAPAAILPSRDVALAVAELERATDAGFKAAMLPMVAPRETPYSADVWEPLWELAAGRHVPISYHVATGALPVTERGPGGAIINYLRVGMAALDLVGYFVAGGVLMRHPDLTVAVVEAGAGWLAYANERMDEAAAEHAAWVKPHLDRRPSDYIRDQIRVTVGADRAPILSREITGIEPLMWASDYPHPEGTWPESQRAIESIFDGTDVSDGDRDAIVGGTAAQLWHLGPR